MFPKAPARVVTGIKCGFAGSPPGFERCALSRYKRLVPVAFTVKVTLNNNALLKGPGRVEPALLVIA